MLGRFFCVGTLFSLALTIATPAAATVMVTTIEGYSWNGSSTVPDEHVGDAFSLVFTTDSTYQSSGNTNGYVYSVSSQGNSSPAVLTIGTEVHKFNNIATQSELFDSTPGANQFNVILTDYVFVPGPVGVATSFLDQIQIIFQAPSFLPLGATYTTPFSNSGGSFGFGKYQNYFATFEANGPKYDYYTNFDLVATSIQSVSETVVPEPETWVMMLGGFGLAGATLRRRAAVSAEAI